jgi:Protein of unknown function (DUF3300)
MARKCILSGAVVAVFAVIACRPGTAQTAPPPSPYPQAPPPYSGQPPAYSPEQMDDLVGRIALYPDPLLAHVLTASTYPDQVQQAAGWAEEHRYLTGDALARAMYDDRLPWDPSVLALVPFPSVLDMMARDPGWTQELGGAVLANQPAVMDAVQRMRQRAMDYGYLRSTPQERVIAAPGDIQIVPVDPGYVFVPAYNPAVVFMRPARGIFVGAAIGFGPRVVVGTAFAPYGWAGPALNWRAHTIIIDRHPWQRTWVNRNRYVHPYVAPTRRAPGPLVEHHEREVREHEHENRGRGHEQDHNHGRGRGHDHDR